MARWFRSEPMEYISLIVNEDASHDCLADLGKLSVVQFTDVSLLLPFCSPLFVIFLAAIQLTNCPTKLSPHPLLHFHIGIIP
jgi:V-type H+-transporting ATPase subunit a